MTILVSFLALWVGLYFKSNYFLSLLFLSLIIVYSIIRLKDKRLLFVLSCALIGIVTSLISSSKTGQINETAIVVDAKDNYILTYGIKGRHYIHIKDHSYDIGDIISISGTSVEVDIITIESQFDFSKYLSKKGVFYEIKNYKIDVKFSNPIRINGYRNYVISRFDDNVKPIVKSLLFSSSDDSSVLSSYKDLHLIRIISLSGIYVYLLLKICKTVLHRHLKDKYIDIISILILSIYALFTFPRFAPIKILFFLIFKFINEYILKNKMIYLNIYSILGIFFLFINPYLAFQDSFILGFLFPLLFYFLRPLLIGVYGIKRKAIQVIAVFFFFIPFELSYYNSISLLAPILSVVLFPLFAIIAIVGFLVFFGLPIAKVNSLFVKPIELISEHIGFFNLEVYAPSFNPLLLIVYYFLFVLIIYLLIIKLKPLYKVSVGPFLGIIIIHFVPIDNLISSSISFINIGQGDATLIRKGTHSILIDTGGLTYLDVAKESIIPYLKKNRIYTIDYVIVTHHDFDHYGGYESLKNNFKVFNYVTDYHYFPFTYQGITFTNYNKHIDKAKEENDRSLVIGFNIAKHDVLIMGDASKEVEKNIIKDYKNIPCDILKVGHHGSNTSSSDEFIKFIKPIKAIISCGKNNKYKHPNKEVIDTLNKYKVEIYRTDISGTITFKNYIFM